MSRGTDAVLAELLALPPPGWAWPRSPDSNLGRALRPVAEELARIEAAAEVLAGQVVPAAGTDLLADYERVLGPDPCGRDLALTDLAQRQAIAQQRWTALGDPTPQFFVDLAAGLGVAITIEEMVPSVCGDAQCGDLLTPQDQAYAWVVHLPAAAVIEAECGAATCGDYLGQIIDPGVECPIRQWVPRHTLCVFSYTEP